MKSPQSEPSGATLPDERKSAAEDVDIVPTAEPAAPPEQKPIPSSPDSFEAWQWTTSWQPAPLTLSERMQLTVKRHRLLLTAIALLLIVALGFLYLRPGFSLSKAAGHVSIVTVPSGATVLLDLDSIGVSPLPKYPLTSGFHILSVRKPGFPQVDTLVFVQKGEYALRIVMNESRPGTRPEQSVTLMEPLQMGPLQPIADTGLPIEPLARDERLQSTPERSVIRSETPAATTGGLLAVSEPAGATLLIDNLVRGETPLLLQDMEPGQYTVVLQRNGFTSHTQQVTVTTGRVVRISGNLQPLTGTLVLSVHPRGSVYIDGVLRAEDTNQAFRTELPVGTHQVRVTHPTLGKWEQTVEINGSTPQQLGVNFLQGAESTPAETPRVTSRPPARTVHLDSVYAVPDEPPQLVSGRNAINTLTEYPKLAAQRGIEGRVFLRFIVDEKGNVQKPEVMRGIGGGCDEEAVRLIRLARFNPGKINGQPVKTWHAMYISFKLSP